VAQSASSILFRKLSGIIFLKFIAMHYLKIKVEALVGYLAAATNSAEKHLPSYDNKRKR